MVKLQSLLSVLLLMHFLVTGMTENAFSAEVEEPTPAPPVDLEANNFTFWAEAGPTTVSSNDRYNGLRLAGGFNVPMDVTKRFTFGCYYSHPFTSEGLTDAYSGRIQRNNFEGSLGYYLIPETTWFRVNAGVAYLTSESPLIAAKIKPTIGFSLGSNFWKFGRNSKLGMEFTFEYMGSANQSIDLFGEGLSCGIGNCNQPGAIPKATIASLSLVYSIHGGK